MKAMVITKPGQILIEERPIPEYKENEVLIKVKAAGICGSDAHIYYGKNAFAVYPRVVGHEFAGEIVKVGKQVKNLKQGDRVTVDPVNSCGHCYACRIGRHNVCTSLSVMGVHRDGGFREYAAANAANVYKVPERIPWKIAAMVEPYSIAAQVLERGRLTADDMVLICGAGPIGLIILQAAKMKGAKVAIMDVVESRLTKAKHMGADLIINSKKSDMVTELMKFTDGMGANLIFEATGNVKVLETCIKDAVSPAGRVVVLGFSTDMIQIPQVAIMSKEIEIIGTRLNNNKFAEVIEWFSKNLVQPEAILSHTFKLEELEKAFAFMHSYPEEVCKIGLEV